MHEWMSRDFYERQVWPRIGALLFFSVALGLTLGAFTVLIVQGVMGHGPVATAWVLMAIAAACALIGWPLRNGSSNGDDQ